MPGYLSRIELTLTMDSTQGGAIRREERVKAETQVLVSDPLKGARLLRTRDVSSGGVFLRCEFEKCPSVGTSVSMKVGIKFFRGRVAHVSRVNDDSDAKVEGFGVAFLTPQPLWWLSVETSATPAASAVEHISTEKAKDAARGLFALGVQQLRIKNYHLAGQKFDQAYKMSQEPQHLAMQLVSRGFEYLATAFLKQAKDAFARALEINPSSSEAIDGLRQVALEEGRAALPRNRRDN